MINKNDLKDKHVTYRDKNGAIRTGKVKKIIGNYLTIIDAVKVRRRIHLKDVLGRQYRKRGLEPIEWKEIQTKKKKKRY